MVTYVYLLNKKEEEKQIAKEIAELGIEVSNVSLIMQRLEIEVPAPLSDEDLERMDEHMAKLGFRRVA